MTIMIETPYVSAETREAIAKQEAEDILIAVYVPGAEHLTHAEALKLAQERDLEAAMALEGMFI